MNSNDFDYLSTVDGTDCVICEPHPFSRAWYSFKHNGPGVRYEIAVSTITRFIIWAHGPYPCGAYSDLKIFRLKLKGVLLPNEKVIADRGYKDEKCAYFPSDMKYPDKLFSKSRARYETFNQRIKQFNMAGQRFRHHVSRHGVCFHAAANITQLMLEYESPLFEL